MCCALVFVVLRVCCLPCSFGALWCVGRVVCVVRSVGCVCILLRVLRALFVCVRVVCVACVAFEVCCLCCVRVVSSA